MKTKSHSNTEGSVLIIAILTLTILSMICGLSLYVTSQNTNATSQTASWQAALSGAESGMETGYYALNKQTWTGWKTVTGSLPTTQPTGGNNTTAAPTSGQYAYYIRTLQVPGEGGGTVKFWTTVDTAGLAVDHNGNQWFRIRATGVAAAPGPARVSNQKRDNDLRRISLRTDRMTGLALSTPQAARTIEAIAQPIPHSPAGRGLTLAHWISMSGGGIVDSFDSSNGLYSTNHLYDPTRRRIHGDLGLIDSTGSDLKNTYVYGNLAYSGPAVKNAGNVQGTISTPFSATVTPTSDPTWSGGTYTTYASGSVPNTVTSGTSANPALIKITGDFTVGGGKTFTVNSANPSSTDNAIIIWVTGKWTTSGSGMVIQDPNVKVTWYVDQDVTTSGSSYSNLSGYAANMTMNAVGTGKVTVSGGGSFIGTLNAPGRDVTISGSGSMVGTLIASTVTISGGASLHYDEALSGSGGVDNYSYASWFEDVADVPRGATY